MKDLWEEGEFEQLTQLMHDAHFLALALEDSGEAAQ